VVKNTGDGFLVMFDVRQRAAVRYAPANWNRAKRHIRIRDGELGRE
jgi:hypothetical protein